MGVDFSEDGDSTDLEEDVDDSDESEGWDDDFVVGADAEGEEGEVEGGGAAGDSDGVFNADVGGELALEGVHLRAYAELRAGEDAEDGSALGVTDVGG